MAEALDLKQAITLVFAVQGGAGSMLSTSQVIAALHKANPRINSGKVIDTLYEMRDQGLLYEHPLLKNKWSLA